MANQRQIQTNFTAGEISRRLLGRGDLRAYDNGALTLTNVFIQPTGGVTRRSGLYYIASLSGPGRLAEFEFNTEQTYLIVFSNLQVQIFQNNGLITTLTAPWATAQLPQIDWSQNADTLLVVHPDVRPQKITRTVSGWTIDPWIFFADTDNVIQQPYFKFADSGITVMPNATTGTITLNASANVFVTGHIGTRFRIQGKEILITDVLSATVAKATAIQTLAGTTATIDWQEQAYSAVHGWPVSCAFHQDRLVVGGARDLPNRLWLSKSGDIFNFNLGTALDDEGIEFAILSDQVNAIRAVFSGRHLQVFTSGAEYMVSGSPLTPSTFQVNRQTRIGSQVARSVQPVDVDGATLFISRDGKTIREFVYTDVEAAYSANDLSLLAAHLLVDPIELAYDKERRIMYIVRADGKVAILTIYRAEEVIAWALLETDGIVLSAASIDNESYFLVQRGSAYTIERLDDTILLDNALVGTSVTPQSHWSGLDHLEGVMVRIVADGVVQSDQTVMGGAITLDKAVSAIQVGLPYTHIIEPLPPNIVTINGIGQSLRLIAIYFRVEDTCALQVNWGRGLKDIPLRRLTSDPVLDQAPESVTSDITVRALGWQRDTTKSLWRIEHDAPLSFTLLSTTTDIKVTE